MIDVSELLTDPDFATAYQIVRETQGSFVSGGEGEWQAGEPTTLDRFGPVQPSKPEDKVDFLPEGERGKNAINVFSKDEIILSDGKNVQSDIILFNGKTWRVANRKPWGLNGYWWAIAVEFQE